MAEVRAPGLCVQLKSARACSVGVVEDVGAVVMFAVCGASGPGLGARTQITGGLRGRVSVLICVKLRMAGPQPQVRMGQPLERAVRLVRQVRSRPLLKPRTPAA